MLNMDQLSKQIAACAEGKLSLNTLEDWFRDHSHNVHLWGDQRLNDFVDAVESVFSEWYFEKLSEALICRKLQDVAQEFLRPFVPPAEPGFVVFCERSLTTTAAIVWLPVALSKGAVTPAIEWHSAASVAGVGASGETASSSSLLLVAAQQA